MERTDLLSHAVAPLLAPTLQCLYSGPFRRHDCRGGRPPVRIRAGWWAEDAPEESRIHVFSAVNLVPGAHISSYLSLSEWPGAQSIPKLCSA